MCGKMYRRSEVFSLSQFEAKETSSGVYIFFHVSYDPSQKDNASYGSFWNHSIEFNLKVHLKSLFHHFYHFYSQQWPNLWHFNWISPQLLHEDQQDIFQL